MVKNNQHNSGFTIVELLIVVVVIGILAAIVIVAYSGVQERSRVTKTNSDLVQLTKAIYAARINQDKTLMEITGSGCTSCSDPDGAKMALALDKIGAAANVNLAALKTGDGWGNWYRLDENEGEAQLAPCTADGLQLNNQIMKVQAGVKIPAVATYRC